jgi:hypothetical protein
MGGEPIWWKFAAKAFYELVLTGGETDAFWKELLE